MDPDEAVLARVLGRLTRVRLTPSLDGVVAHAARLLDAARHHGVPACSPGAP